MEIILPEYAKYIYEINMLRLRAARNIAYRDALKYHICKYIGLDYMLKIGALEYKQMMMSTKVDKAKRMLYYLKEKKVKIEELPDIIHKEFEEQENQVLHMGEAVNDAIDLSLAKTPTEAELDEVNGYYLTLVRDYSPEINPKNTNEEKALFEKIFNAYILADVKEMKRYNKCKKEDLFFDELDEYKKEKIRLTELLDKTSREIAEIKNTFPYSEKLRSSR